MGNFEIAIKFIGQVIFFKHFSEHFVRCYPPPPTFVQKNLIQNDNIIWLEINYIISPFRYNLERRAEISGIEHGNDHCIYYNQRNEYHLFTYVRRQQQFDGKFGEFSIQ